MKNIQNKARINEDLKDALIQHLQKEIKDLQEQLKECKKPIIKHDKSLKHGKFFILLKCRFAEKCVYEILGEEISGPEETDESDYEAGEPGESRLRRKGRNQTLEK